MAISSIGQNTYTSGLQQKQQNMNNMFAALNSGDLATAQKAYASSGMPAMAANNTSPLGRLYNALRNEDLKSAQQAALDMQGHSKSKGTVINTPNSSSKPASSTDPKADLKAAALELVKQSKSQTNLSSLLGLGNNINMWG